MNVLVVGGGGREHALCWAISRSPMQPAVFCAPGNAGIADVATCINIAADDLDAIVAFSVKQAMDFVVVGPEGPLCRGLIDQLEGAGIKAFGPRRGAAQIEGSKIFMKDLCARTGIPTADYRQFDEPEAAKEYVRSNGVPIVAKADGLAAGKGVVICRTENEAYAAIDHILVEGAFGAAGANLVIEQYLEGEEASFLALVDGTDIVPLASSQDHKTACDGDLGPNTGGMGAYSPAPVVTAEMTKIVMDRIMRPAVKELHDIGCSFSGVLYAGLMFTHDGPKLLEFNCRFGDPECQPLLMRLRSDVLDALLACSEGRLGGLVLEWHEDAALSVVMAANGYPGYYGRGSEIKGLKKLAGLEDVMVFHAGTEKRDGRILANGGRVLCVTARGRTVAAAQRRAYEAVAEIEWHDGYCRRDIGWRALVR